MTPISNRRSALEPTPEVLARLLFASAPDAVVITDGTGRIVMTNRAANQMLGYAPSELFGQRVEILLPKRLHRKHAAFRQDYYAAPRIRQMGEGDDLVAIRKDGTEIRIEINIAFTPGDAGTFVACILHDVTERRRAAARIHFQAHLLDTVAQAVIATDLTGKILYWNRFAETLYGWPSSEALGQDALNIVIPSDARDRAASVLRRIARGDNWSAEIRMRRRDGSEFMALLSGSPIRDEDGALIGIIGLATDITERLRLEEQFLQAQKMESIGRLAGGAAHDFNNLLTTIIGQVDLAFLSLPQDHELRRELLEMRQTAERAAGLANQLLAVSRRQIAEPRIIDLNDMVATMDTLLRRIVGEDVEVSLVASPGIGLVRIDPGQFEQVLLNLVVNARDAMPNGGKLVLETALAALDDTYGIAHPGVEPGDYVMLAVTDTGAGMTPEVRQHLFEPFFTTKERGVGTGLGLATSYGIIKQAGGYIWAYSEPGRGTTFKIYLPRVEGTVDAIAPGDDARDLPPGTETVLVVEDESSIRQLTARALRACGYTVLEAPDAEAALRAARRHQGPIDLLLTDVVMPGMDGRELSDQLRALRPAMRVLFTSGYAPEVALRHGVADLRQDFLAKPYAPGTLARKIRECLDR